MKDCRPLVIDLFCGSFGWSQGFLANGWRSIGFDVSHEPHHGPVPAGASLVLQNVLTIHGSQFKDADCLVMSPPCQQYSWLAMPWSRSTDPNNSKAAKALRKRWETEGPDNRLFDACFRIQREAIAATAIDCPACFGGGHRNGDPPPHCPRCDGEGYVTRHIPMIVENVGGAQEWVGPAKANYGSFYLWGDVGMVGNRIVIAGRTMPAPTRGSKVPGVQTWSDFGKPGYKATAFNGQAERNMAGVKVPSEDGRRTNVGKGARFTPRDCGVEADGTKQGGDWFQVPGSISMTTGSKSSARKAASAMIAKIPFPLSDFVARTLKPQAEAAV